MIQCFLLPLSWVNAAWGSGASTVKMPSLDNEDRICSASVPAGSRNSRLYSRKTVLPWDCSSCLACTWNLKKSKINAAENVSRKWWFTNNLLSTVLTTISSGEYWLTSNRSLSSFCPSPWLLSSAFWIKGESRPCNQFRWLPRPLADNESVVLATLKRSKKLETTPTCLLGFFLPFVENFFSVDNFTTWGRSGRLDSSVSKC